MEDMDSNSQEDRNLMNISCRSGHADGGEAIERQNVEVSAADDNGRIDRVGDIDKIILGIPENEGNIVRDILTNDVVSQAGDINDGASCSGVTRSPNIGLVGSTQEGKNSPSAIEIRLGDCDPNLASNRSLTLYNGIVGDIKGIFYPTEKLTCSAAALLYVSPYTSLP